MKISFNCTDDQQVVHTHKDAGLSDQVPCSKPDISPEAYLNDYRNRMPFHYIEEGSDREVLHPAVFSYPYIKCKLRDRDLIKKFAEDNRYVEGRFRTDGAVIYIINPKLQDILGRSNEKNNFEVAYKFTEETAMTELKRIEFSVRNFGRITPVAVFKPVKIKGNTVSRASIGSKARFDTLSLAKGDDVILHYDIIPYITVGPGCLKADRSPIEFVTE